LGVDLNWFRKRSLGRLTPDVENISAFGTALIIDEMEDAFGVHCGLGLDAVVGGSKEINARVIGQRVCANGQDESGNEQAFVFHRRNSMITTEGRNINSVPNGLTPALKADRPVLCCRRRRDGMGRIPD
jgi:hypothetical protein